MENIENPPHDLSPTGSGSGSGSGSSTPSSKTITMASHCKPPPDRPDHPTTPPLDPYPYPYPEPYPANPPLQGRPNGATAQSTQSPSSRPRRYRRRDYVLYSQTQNQLPQFTPYTDTSPISTSPISPSTSLSPSTSESYEDDDPDDNVPLAYLYPSEAPPSYIAAVTQAYHSTLISHIRSRSESLTHSTMSTERALDDGESGFVSAESQEARFKVQKMVAMLVVAFVVFVLGGVVALFVAGVTDLRLRW